MAKKTKIRLGILFVFLLFIFATGCDLIKKDKGSEVSTDFKRGAAGLVMEFVPNYPGDRYIVSEGIDEDILIMIDLKNKGTYPDGDHFGNGSIHISGFDSEIINMDKKRKDLDEDMFLPAASSINPLGGFSTVEFEGKIIAKKITIDEYNPTILATACYPYVTKASPAVCIDPSPFDDRQEKVCHIGSQTLETQGAPVAITKIDQEASTNKIQFKIAIENVGSGDVLTPEDIFGECDPWGFGTLGRKDFDRVQVKTIKVGKVDLWDADKSKNKCGPFADGSNDLIRLFNGEGFVICTLTVSELEGGQSAYTTPLNIELEYNYRSTISKSISISKLTSVGG